MLLRGVFWENIRKHGFVKGTIGGYLMYPSVIMFFIFQVLFLRILTKVLVIFNAEPLNKEDYIDYGRINLANYSWFDRLNCHFCAYANGTTHMVYETLGIIGSCNIGEMSNVQKKKADRLLKRSFFWAKPVGLIGMGFVIAFEKLLGYKKADLMKIKDDLKNNNFGKTLKSNEYISIYRNTFKLRIVFQSFQMFLSTIESNWCPLAYANKSLLLEHQKRFISTNYDDVVTYINETKNNEMPV